MAQSFDIPLSPEHLARLIMGVTDIQSGHVYRLTNVGNTSCVLDLSGADNRSVIGYSDHGGQNQRWMLDRTSDGWTIRNLGSGTYAGVENYSTSNGAKVIALESEQKYFWHIWQDERNKEHFRISVPHVKKSLDLSNHGKGPDIEIWGQWEGLNQLWTFDEESSPTNVAAHYEHARRRSRYQVDMASTKKVIVVAGVGNGGGTGAAVARLFAKEGYAVALLARAKDSLILFEKQLNEIPHGEAVAFPLSSYSTEAIKTAWASIKERFKSPSYEIRVAVWNTGYGVFKKFLDVTVEDIEQSMHVNSVAAFAFSREAILTFKENSLEGGNGKRGALIFTGATASLRGNVFTSAFASGKFALRALSQSLNKEFGKENIHVAHVIIDGVIRTERNRDKGSEWEQNEDIRLNAESIANSYLYLVRQDRSAWTWELDLRPAHEKW
ncbi:hypothetical protein D9756_011244 [Leucocoprinus leucothites]|uniref:Ricin B lectin domain-containing protein n=1 Tax=Leucocoprinus leucothites TaxID=201217 RepID=A0A8H5CS52_9AGAR|nr:hypothetical protein D9756_011244 [Leucoagaricus leucothites]